MRVGPLRSAGSPLRLLLVLVLVALALPASARAQEPAAVVFSQAPSGVRPSVPEEFAFSAQGAASYACALDGGTPQPCTSPHTVPAQGNGAHVLAVRALAADGTTVVASGEVSWVVDTQAPAATISSGPSGQTPTGAASIAFGSEAADLERLECSLDGAPFETCTSPEEVSVTPGDHTFQVRAVDVVGNAGEPDSISWTGVQPPPAGLPSISGGPSGLTASRSAAFSFTADGAVSYKCAVDGAAFAACTSPVSLTGLADGSHTFAVQGLDAGAAPGPVAERTWTVDGTAPVVAFTALPEGAGGDLTFTFAFSLDDPTATVECTVDGVPIAGCAAGAPVTATLTGDATGMLLVKATDKAGNVSSLKAVEVDLEGPSLTIGGGPADPTREATAALTATSEPSAGVFCRLQGPGHEADAFAPCTGVRSYEGLASGTYTFEAYAEDAGGNRTEAQHTWRVDQQAPALAFTAGPGPVSTGATADLAFAADEELQGVTCTLDGAPVSPCTGGATVPSGGAGSHTFRVEATDLAGNPAAAERTWRTFAAALDWAPATPVIGEAVAFRSQAAGDVVALAWDVDDDGAFDDGGGAEVQRTFADPGSYLVRLRVTHRSGVTDTAVREVAVGRTPLTVTPPVTPPDTGRKPPVAAFAVAPQAPVAGQGVTLTSTASDPDGAIAATAWDLDGDGEFDDATGPAASRAYPAGTQVVGMRVVDTDGLAATAFATLTIAPAAGAPGPPPAPGPKALPLLKPFPTVRIAGTAVGSRIRVRILAVKAPRNTTVEVRCRGRGCPIKVDRQRVRGKTRVVRIRRLERRVLRAGTVLEIRVHAPGRIGKYTRLFMRAGAAPKRTDACVSGARLLKVACPA